MFKKNPSIGGAREGVSLAGLRLNVHSNNICIWHFVIFITKLCLSICSSTNALGKLHGIFMHRCILC